MAHSNINERRAYVKSIMELGEITRTEIKEAAGKFNCTYSTILADIAMINKRGEYTMYPGRNTKNAVLERDRYACQYCGNTESKLFVDHVIPTSMGGVGHVYNLVAACGSCNARKGKNGKVWTPMNIDVLKALNPGWYEKILTLSC